MEQQPSKQASCLIAKFSFQHFCTHNAVNRFLRALQLPGQLIGIKYSGGKEQKPTWPASRLFAIASSPYEPRRESALLDASLIEVFTTTSDCM